MGAVRIVDELVSGRVKDTWLLSDLPDQITVRELVRTRVREEVARFNLDERDIFSGLVQPSETETVANGYRLSRRRTLDWEQQADIAERAFTSNGFFVLVDDRQVESLDDVLDLRVDPQITFIKLLPLVGG